MEGCAKIFSTIRIAMVDRSEYNMKKIVVLNGSGRVGGNTSALIDAFARGLRRLATRWCALIWAR